MTDARPVEVLHGDGVWYPGTLTRWKRDDRGWVGHVWWSEGPGLNHVGWIASDRLRRTGEVSPPSPERQAELDRVYRAFVAGPEAGLMDLGGSLTDGG